MHIPYNGLTPNSRVYKHWQTLTAADVMCSQVITAQIDWGIDYLARFLTERHISGAPVVDEFGLLCGIVSATDIMNYLGGGAGSQNGRTRFCERTRYNHNNPFAVHSRFLTHTDRQDAIVVDIMTPIILSVDPNMQLTKVAEAMCKADINRVLVTEGRQLKGIITISDLLEQILDNMKH